MKQCPKCQKTYDDSWSVCLADSTKLTILEEPVLVPGSQYHETVQCPFCREVIIKGAIKCKHCREFLDKARSTSMNPQGSDSARAVAKGLKEKEAADIAFNFLIGCTLVVSGFLGYAFKSWWVFGIVCAVGLVLCGMWYYRE